MQVIATGSSISESRHKCFPSLDWAVGAPNLSQAKQVNKGGEQMVDILSGLVLDPPRAKMRRTRGLQARAWTFK